jgi:hypothetical protein
VITKIIKEKYNKDQGIAVEDWIAVTDKSVSEDGSWKSCIIIRKYTNTGEIMVSGGALKQQLIDSYEPFDFCKLPEFVQKAISQYHYKED